MAHWNLEWPDKMAIKFFAPQRKHLSPEKYTIAFLQQSRNIVIFLKTRIEFLWFLTFFL